MPHTTPEIRTVHVTRYITPLREGGSMPAIAVVATAPPIPTNATPRRPLREDSIALLFRLAVRDRRQAEKRRLNAAFVSGVPAQSIGSNQMT